jgi:hypothetical protein
MRHASRALQWVPMNIFPKIPEIDLRRFSLQFSFGVIVAIHEKFEKFQNISIEDLSENLQYLEKRFQCDNAVYRNKCRNNEAFSRYASYHWVFCFRRDICKIPNGYPWATHATLCTQEIKFSTATRAEIIFFSATRVENFSKQMKWQVVSFPKK